MKIKIFLLPILALVLSAFHSAHSAELTTFIAKMDVSKWQMGKNDRFECELKHDIPKFGTATFYQHAARPLKLRLTSRYDFKKGTEVSFRSVSAYWKTPNTQADIATIVIQNGEDFDVGEPYARQAFFELQEGNFPSFYFFDSENNDNPIAVALSTVRFNTTYNNFKECVLNLYKHNFNDINVAYVLFDFDNEFPIQGQDEVALKNMLDYMKLDPSVTRFMVSGHTDERGRICYNDTLSERRALYVYDLVLADLDTQRIDYQFAGESQPIDKRKNEKAWAKNRRVKVEMFRD